jgi:hypothetical protein
MKIRAWHKQRQKWITFDNLTYCDEYNIMGFELSDADCDPNGGTYCNLSSDLEDFEKFEFIADRK